MYYLFNFTNCTNGFAKLTNTNRRHNIIIISTPNLRRLNKVLKCFYVNSINDDRIQKKTLLHCGHAGCNCLGLSNQERKRHKQRQEH